MVDNNYYYNNGLTMFNDYVPPSWDELFIRGVYWIATKSKDPRTKIGAVIVKDNIPLLWGFNGIPKKVKDLPERLERPLKYKYIAHAERNALNFGSKYGISTDGGILYTNGLPCTNCSISIIQSGIKEIVIHKQWEDLGEKFMKNRDEWKGQHDISLSMFNEADIKIRVFDKQLYIDCYLDGRKFAV